MEELFFKNSYFIPTTHMLIHTNTEYNKLRNFFFINYEGFFLPLKSNDINFEFMWVQVFGLYIMDHKLFSK